MQTKRNGSLIEIVAELKKYVRDLGVEVPGWKH